MTKHKYYECDICGSTAKKMANEKGHHIIVDLANFLLENVNVRDVCTDCVNEILPEARNAVKKRYGVNKIDEEE